jgi:hypothetical protein
MADRVQDRVAAVALGATGVVIIAAGLSLPLTATPPPAPPDSSPDPTVPLPGGLGRRFEAVGIVRPPAVAGAPSPLSDAEAVLGVEAGGRVRAYRVGALSRADRHVVNDVLGGRPVTVTYCDRTHCGRVLTGPGDEPLGVGVGGYLDGLVLTVGGYFYRQDTLSAVADGPAPDCPLTDIGFEATTWGEWRRDHPDTDVYVSPP